MADRRVTNDDFPVGEDAAIVALRKYAVLLDSAFQVPGTQMRFGLDPLVGLIPGVGDLVTGFFSVMILLHSLRLKIPKIVVARMLVNTGLDLAAGAVPILGDLFDAGYKANLKNLRLLERHARPGVKPETSDYVFVSVAISIVLLAAIVPILVLWWLLTTAKLF
jgi:hypothetical protein